MYLKRLHIENNGPLRQLDIKLPFTVNGAPKPVILVGGNGSGKTNLLSIVADALFEAAATHYHDLTPRTGLNHSFFRLVGSTTVSIGAPGGCAILQFEHSGASYFYKEKAGHLLATEVSARLPEEMRPASNWVDTGVVKEFTISDEIAEQIFEKGAYVYFPSSRSEAPHWLNRESVPAVDFNLAPRITKRLRKPIYIEKGLDHLKQWLLALLLDGRADIDIGPIESGRQSFTIFGNPMEVIANKSLWTLVNQIIQEILDEKTARLAWLGRNSAARLAIASGHNINAPELNALSTGQIALLVVFGTLLRYGDNEYLVSAFRPQDITGICLIDEVDAHMHVDLQYRALPALMKIFPNVQFIVSNHSPLFVLGMEKVFGADGILVIDMPSGTPVQAEAYTEFERALQVMQETKAFGKAIAETASIPGKFLVLLEGETDPEYLNTAAELLGRGDLLNMVEFAWVGAKDPKSGQGFHTGKDALNHTLSVLRAKPELVKRPVLLLYDNDAKKVPESYDNVHILGMPSNPANTNIEAGIENLLPSAAITPDMFDKKESKKPNGSQITSTTLNKMRLCNLICKKKRAPTDFTGFTEVLDMVEAIAKKKQGK